MGKRKTPLSDDARAVAGSHFGLMRRGGTVGIASGRQVTARAQTALDELVDHGLVAFEATGEGTTYTALADCSAHLRWLGRNPGQGRFAMVDPETVPLPAP
jgi:hypothetical protein